MPTFTALTTLPGRDAAETLGTALEALDPAPTGVGVFEVEDGSGLWEVGAYFTETPDDVALALLAAAHGAKPFAVSELPEVDWVAHVKRELAPVPAGRFYVYGSHDADTVPEGAEPLLIEAAMAFGTGHHGTTLGCLLAFDQLLAADQRPEAVLDLGCGTAVLAMAAARVVPEATILASDIDPVAIDVAEANLAANGLTDSVEALVAEGLDDPRITAAAPFDLVFANILMGPLIDLAPGVAGVVAGGGHTILSGILNDQADTVAEAYLAQGHVLERRDIHGEWTTLTLRRL